MWLKRSNVGNDLLKPKLPCEYTFKCFYCENIIVLLTLIIKTYSDIIIVFL